MKIIKIKACRNRKGCVKPSYEVMQGKTFETIKQAA